MALVTLLLIMLFSAFRRLGLYEAAYPGFSRLRTYTHVFLIWIGLLLIVTIALEIIHKERMFMFAALVASFGFAISSPFSMWMHSLWRKTFSASCTLRQRILWIWMRNIFWISDDAIPSLVAAFQTPSS